MTQEFYFLCTQSSYVPATNVLGIKHRVLHMLGKYSTSELCPQSSSHFYFYLFFCRKDLANLPRLLLNVIYILDKTQNCDSPASASQIATITDLSHNTHQSQGPDTWSSSAKLWKHWLKANDKMNWEQNANVAMSKRKQEDLQVSLVITFAPSEIPSRRSQQFQKVAFCIRDIIEQII